MAALLSRCGPHIQRHQLRSQRNPAIIIHHCIHTSMWTNSFQGIRTTWRVSITNCSGCLPLAILPRTTCHWQLADEIYHIESSHIELPMVSCPRQVVPLQDGLGVVVGVAGCGELSHSAWRNWRSIFPLPSLSPSKRHRRRWDHCGS